MRDDWKFRPLSAWPEGASRARRRSLFKGSYSATMAMLERELDQLGARRVVIEIGLSEHHIRMDGRPRANAPEPADPGVILSFESRHGPLRYATAEFDRWRDNLRAIALGLEALRKVDRYGITRRGEQYQGWRQLPQHVGSGFSSADEAALWIEEQAGRWRAEDILDDRGALDEAYRYLARHLHPDRPGGDEGEFVKLGQARALIGEAQS